MLQRIYIGIYAQSWQAREEGSRKKTSFFFLALWLDIDLLTIIWCEHVLQRIISLGLIRWKKISFMTYFDWKYYKELLIGNKELGKVQGEFTVVVIKIKNGSAFIAEFSPPSLCMSQKKKEKERKRGIQMLQENYFVMCRQAKRSYNCIAIKWFFPSINYPITSAVVVIILLLPTKKRWYFSLIVQGCFFIQVFYLGLVYRSLLPYLPSFAENLFLFYSRSKHRIWDFDTHF